MVVSVFKGDMVTYESGRLKRHDYTSHSVNRTVNLLLNSFIGCTEKSFLQRLISLFPFFSALIQLDRPAFLNKHVSLACLPRQNLEMAAGKICYATGIHQMFYVS